MKLKPFMFLKGKYTIRVPIEQCNGPEPEWGARTRNEAHVKVLIFLIPLFLKIFIMIRIKNIL